MKLDSILAIAAALSASVTTTYSFTQPRFPVSNILIRSSTAPSDSLPLLRIGHGFDIHRLIENKKLLIAGVEIPSPVGADAHSDGDAVYHR